IGDDNNNNFKYQTCMASNGEEFIVAWLDSRGGSKYDIYAQRLTKNGEKIGNNFIVNSDSQSVRKKIPDIALKDNGSFLVTWYAYVNKRNSVFAVSLDSNNNLIGSQFTVSDSTFEVSSDFGSVTSSSKSGYIIAWQRYLNNDYNIISQIVDSASIKIDSNFIVNDDLTSSQLYPSIDSDSLGNVIINWYDYRNGYAQIYAQDFAGDIPIENNFKVSEDEIKGSKREISCSVSPEGNLISTWLDFNAPTEDRIYSRILDKNNNPISSSTRIDTDSFSSMEQNPSIEVFNDGTQIIAWSDQRNKLSTSYYQMYDSSSTPIGENIQVNSTSTQYDTKITKLSNQNFAILWREYTRGTFNQNEIIAQKYFKTGEILGEKIIVSSNEIKGSASSFDASSNSSGEFAVTFQKRVNNINLIYAQKFNQDGTAKGNNILVSQDTTINFYKPKIALDSIGNFAVTYYGNTGKGHDIFLKRYNNVGIEIDTTIIVNDDLNLHAQYNPDISINSTGDCIVTWFDYRTPVGIYFQKYKNIGSNEFFEKIDSNIAVTDYTLAFCTPTVSLNNLDNFVISWNQLNDSFYDLKFRLFGSNLIPTSDVLDATSNKERNQKNQQIYFTNDKIYNVWQDNHEKGIGYDIWANTFDYNDLITDIKQVNIELPKEFNLSHNYPNPFNPITTIKYNIPKVTADFSQRTTLKIYNVLGKEIRTLVNEHQEQGQYEVNFDGSNLASGTYFYRLQFEDFSETKKMILLK
ncbi:MAG: T9SS type A sorting domain-containing protein, partial [Melioribacteraceae bacterium]